MLTSHIESLLPNLTLEEGLLKDGTKRFLGSTSSFDIEIIPDKAVSFFIREVNKDILKILDSYSGSTSKSLDLLKRGAKAMSENPNKKFRDYISDDLFLSYTKIAPTGGLTIHLVIEEG